MTRLLRRFLLPFVNPSYAHAQSPVRGKCLNVGLSLRLPLLCATREDFCGTVQMRSMSEPLTVKYVNSIKAS